MFNLCEVTKTELEHIATKDYIPYALTGARVLHRQGHFGTGVKVAVVDTGCDYNHEAIKAKIVERTHNLTYYSPNDSIDDEGHGTHVASSILEIATDSEVVPYKVLAPEGGGEWSWLITALNQIADRDDIDVINMSLSGHFSCSELHLLDQLHEAINRCHDKNIFMVCASGNTGAETTLYPACFDEVTTVGAVDINRNEALFSTLSDQVDVCQVGVDVIGAKLGGGYIKMTGTSMAAPLVSGIAGLLIGKYKEQNGGKRPEGRLIHNMLKLSAIDMNIKGLDTKTGAGFISLDPSAGVLEMQIGIPKYFINGKEFQMDGTPYLNTKENRSYVPIRYANYGKLIDWDVMTKKITIV